MEWRQDLTRLQASLFLLESRFCCFHITSSRSSLSPPRHLSSGKMWVTFKCLSALYK